MTRITNMDPKDEIKVEVNDEAELDKVLDESIASVNAGNKLQPKVETNPEVKTEETPLEPKVENTSDSPVVEKKEEGYEFRIPNKGKFESDEAYELRVQLLDQVKRRKTATNPETKQQLSEEISKTRGQLKNLNGSDKINNPLNQSVVETKVEEDPSLKADRERLAQLGGATKEDIQEILRQGVLSLPYIRRPQGSQEPEIWQAFS